MNILFGVLYPKLAITTHLGDWYQPVGYMLENNVQKHQGHLVLFLKYIQSVKHLGHYLCTSIGHDNFVRPYLFLCQLTTEPVL